ncbi:MAG: magnesium chelatase domain-containing protein, partial [Eubacteriales bacterium]|nr:magnesium chelatase domain-containing protein [Eubacteriales bacterium]
LAMIARRAALKGNIHIGVDGARLVSEYATNGRDAVNLVQMAAGMAILEGRQNIDCADIEWVAENARLTRNTAPRILERPAVGVVNGMALQADGQGVLLRIEARAVPAGEGRGIVHLTGALEEEEMGREGHRMRRKSAMLSSVENVCTVLTCCLGVRTADYDIHINFPGSMPVDGPSAGVALACAVYSAIVGRTVDNRVGFTGELSIMGDVYPVGGVADKLKAALRAGVQTVYIPAANYQQAFDKLDAQIIPIENIAELFGEHAVLTPAGTPAGDLLSASPGVPAL